MISRRSSLTAIALGIGFPLIAAAQTIPVVICSGLAGCGQPVENTLFNNILPAIISLGIRTAAGGCVIFIVISGVRMLLSSGDEGKATAARKNLLYALGGLGVCLTAATLVGFVITENYGQDNQTDFIFGSGGLLHSTLRIILLLFNVGFVLMVMTAGVRMTLAGGSPDEFKKGGEVIKWAIVGAIVVNLARMIVAAFLNLDL